MQSKEAVVDEAAAGPLRLQGRRDVCAHGRGSRCMRAGIGEREVGRWRRVGSGLDLTRERERESVCVCKKDGRRACLRSPLGCLAAPPRLYGDRARDSATEQERRVLGWAGVGCRAAGPPRLLAAQVALPCCPCCCSCSCCRSCCAVDGRRGAGAGRRSAQGLVVRSVRAASRRPSVGACAAGRGCSRGSSARYLRVAIDRSCARAPAASVPAADTCCARWRWVVRCRRGSDCALAGRGETQLGG